MANRWMQQFLFSFVKKLTWVGGFASLVQEVKATLVTQGVTLTAAAFGSAGNSITIAFTSGGTAGSEVVTVVGNAISVQIQSGTSTVTQVRTAINASGAAAALVAATGTSASTVATAGALSLTGGVDGVSGFTAPGVASITQTGVGEFTITLQDSYVALVSAKANLQSATAQDLVPQLKSNDVVTAKTVVIRTLTGSSATDPTSACTLYFGIHLRNSQVAV